MMDQEDLLIANLLEEDDFEEDDIYSGGVRDELIDEDELTSAEDAFMQGWETAGSS